MSTAGTCYIAGPMRGYPEFNFPAFDSVADYMRFHGWVVFNPAEHDLEIDPAMKTQPAFATGDVDNLAGFSFQAAMRWDLARVTESDAIVLLPGWEKSSGAGHEKYVAEVCGVEVLYACPTSVSNPGSQYDGDEWFVSEVNVCSAELV